MSGEKKFSTSVFGFKKQHVNSYLEKMNKEYEEKLKIKENEIADIRAQYREIKNKYDELFNNINKVEEDKGKIANTLIIASQKAETIIDEATRKSIEERNKLEKQVEQEKEKLVDIKKDIKNLKNDIVKIMNKYDKELSELINE